MFAKLKKIFGVRELPALASRQKNFLPERDVPAGGIEGVADDGSVWEPWRVDRLSGEQWYQRASAVGPMADSPIRGIAFDDDYADAADDGDSLDPLSPDDEFEPIYETDPETGERVYNAALILRNAKARNRAREQASRLAFRCDDAGDDFDGDEVSQ